MVTKITRSNTKMSFAGALIFLQSGRKVAREIWTTEFVYLVPGSKFTVNRAPLNAIYPEGTEVTYRPHIDFKAADGTCGVWSPTMEDILAQDWLEVMEC